MKILPIFLMFFLCSACTQTSQIINVPNTIKSKRISRKEKLNTVIPSRTGQYGLDKSRINSSISKQSTNLPRIRKKRIQLRDNPNVRKHLALYSGSQKKFISDGLARKAKYQDMMEREFIAHGLSPELINIAHIESRFITDARSGRGAVGIWQFMPRTAKAYGLKVGFINDERKDPVKSTKAAVRYLKDLDSSFDDPLLAIAAYNAGEWGIKRAMKKCNTNDFFKLRACSGLKEETINFVSKFIAITLITRRKERHGF